MAEAQVYEYELGGIRVGQRRRSRSRPTRADYRGRIAFIEPVLDRETRTAGVRIELPNPRGVEARHVRQRAARDLVGPALTIPKSAVIDTGARRVVYVETAPDASRRAR